MERRVAVEWRRRCEYEELTFDVERPWGLGSAILCYAMTALCEKATDGQGENF